MEGEKIKIFGYKHVHYEKRIKSSDFQPKFDDLKAVITDRTADEKFTANDVKLMADFNQAFPNTKVSRKTTIKTRYLLYLLQVKSTATSFRIHSMSR